MSFNLGKTELIRKGMPSGQRGRLLGMELFRDPGQNNDILSCENRTIPQKRSA